MSYAQFIPEKYTLESFCDPIARGRDYFERQEGKLICRRINLRKIPPDAVDLPQRPEYHPHIDIFQMKEIENDPSFSFLCFSQRYSVHEAFLDTLEQFLRQRVTSIPTPEIDKIPERFIHYYDTDFALITCDETRVTLQQQIALAGEAAVFQPLAERIIFRGADLKAGATLRMIEPNILEAKLKEIEAEAAYKVSVSKAKDVSQPFKLLYYEHKDGWDHWAIKAT